MQIFASLGGYSFQGNSREKNMNNTFTNALRLPAKYRQVDRQTPFGTNQTIGDEGRLIMLNNVSASPCSLVRHSNYSGNWIN